MPARTRASMVGCGSSLASKLSGAARSTASSGYGSSNAVRAIFRSFRSSANVLRSARILSKAGRGTRDHRRGRRASGRPRRDRLAIPAWSRPMASRKRLEKRAPARGSFCPDRPRERLSRRIVTLPSHDHRGVRTTGPAPRLAVPCRRADRTSGDRPTSRPRRPRNPASRRPGPSPAGAASTRPSRRWAAGPGRR